MKKTLIAMMLAVLTASSIANVAFAHDPPKSGSDRPIWDGIVRDGQ